jgi:hypothetical protein
MFSRKKTDAGTESAMGQAKLMGLFSYGLGTAQVLRPGSVNRIMGVPDYNPNHALQRLIGIREIVTGTGVLFGGRTSTWMWARVGGDIMDIMVIGGTLAGDLGTKKKLVPTLAILTAIAVIDAKVAVGVRDS